MISSLLEKYPEFKKKWYKSIFPYSLKLGRGHNFLEEEFTSRELRRFIEGSTIIYMNLGQVIDAEHGAFVFDGQVQVEATTYSRGNFISKEKTIKCISPCILLKFTDILGLNVHN